MTAQVAYPGVPPGPTRASVNAESVLLENDALSYRVGVSSRGMTSLDLTNKHTGQTVAVDRGFLPQIVFKDGRRIDLLEAPLADPLRLNGDAWSATFYDEASGLRFSFRASLEAGMNAVVHTLGIRASRDAAIEDLVFLEARIPEAGQVGQVRGSVVVCEHVFAGVEHPLAKNTVTEDGRVRCSIPQGSILKAGASWTHTFAFGVMPEGQVRRGFGYYIDRRRAHGYRQFLHYNNWYDVRLGRPVDLRMTEQVCLEAVHYFGTELVKKRNVKVDAVVWDDGWDDYENSLWGFHAHFPDGLKNLRAVAEAYGMGQGVWLSPKGGYAYAKDARIAHGKALGYEVNAGGFSMAGPRYFRAFLDVCLRMMHEHGVVFFKFDSLGDGGQNAGRDITLSADVTATLELILKLREAREGVYVSATAGTWASPYWLLYADNIWRQGGDTGHYGAGNSRQDWMTYRDMFTYNHVVKAGPLYPLNSLMLHGVVVGNREGRAPAGMVLDEQSVADEVWTFFGSGTCLQELYVSPGVPTERMLDDIAAAANWARANARTLIDSHWVGGSPEHGQVYGWASWQPSKGILVLRNPSNDSQSLNISLRKAFDLPASTGAHLGGKVVYSHGFVTPKGPQPVDEEITMALQPWEVVVMEWEPVGSPKEYETRTGNMSTTAFANCGPSCRRAKPPG